jgi:MFS family permease
VQVGVSWALASVVGQLVQPCGYSNTVVGVLSIGCGFSGVFGSFGTAWVLQRYPDSILTVQKVMLVLTAGTALWCLAVNRPGHFGQLVAPWVLYGLASGPLVPVTLGLAAEITYPIPADNSAALLFTGAITVFFVVTILLTALLRLPTSQSCSNLVTPASVMLTLLVLVGAGIALPMRIGQVCQPSPVMPAASYLFLHLWFCFIAPAPAAAAPGAHGRVGQGPQDQRRRARGRAALGAGAGAVAGRQGLGPRHDPRGGGRRRRQRRRRDR